ncbi:MAG: hypothetical protein ACYS4W_06590 [Planctomycetota bacterium]|jgi:hypothetical protein
MIHRSGKSKVDVLTVLRVGSIVTLAMVLVRTRLPMAREFAGRVPCGTVMSGLAKALAVYAHDDAHDRLPPGDIWCDSLLELDYTTPKGFLCRGSDAIEGESSYAINKYAAGNELALLPGDMVLLFETDFGKDRRGRQELLKNRGWYQTAGYGEQNKKVHKNRWNQTGGAEILTTEHHDKGCYVAFVGGEVKRVESNGLPELKWKADPNDK